eukprot:scaffold163698_cov22-Tisochrysis_lutea.AAC.1
MPIDQFSNVTAQILLQGAMPPPMGDHVRLRYQRIWSRVGFIPIISIKMMFERERNKERLRIQD